MENAFHRKAELHQVHVYIRFSSSFCNIPLIELGVLLLGSFGSDRRIFSKWAIFKYIVEGMPYLEYGTKSPEYSTRSLWRFLFPSCFENRI